MNGSRMTLYCAAIARIFLVGIMVLLPGVAAEAELTETAAAALTGAELVRNLPDPASRSRAFFELCRRNHPEKITDYDSFLAKHYDLEFIACPQGEGKPPLSLVLYGFLDRARLLPPNGYEIANPRELFPEAPGTRAVREPALMFFTLDGQEVRPFGGHTVLHEGGTIADLNNDGLIERADHILYGIEGVRSVDVFSVATIGDTPTVLLSVLFNWGTDDWHYRIADTDRDGIAEISFGPRDGAGIEERVVYHWDREQSRYTGPVGGEGEHFRQIQSRRWAAAGDELRGFKGQGLVFPSARAAPNELSDRTASRFGGVPLPAELSRPYRYASLRGLSDSELIRYMGRGKTLQDLENELVPRTRAPDRFWDLPPDSAAVTMAEINRSPNHRDLYRLAVDGRDGAAPPEAGSISLACQPGGCFGAQPARSYYLRFSPEQSYFAYASSREFGHTGLRPIYDLRLYELPYPVARHLARTIWWLNRVRSQENRQRHGMSSWGSSSDGHAALIMRDDDGRSLIELDAKRWAEGGPAMQRWLGAYTRETCINLSDFLLSTTLPEYLGGEWSKREGPWFEAGGGMILTEAGTAAEAWLPVMARDFLSKYSLDERQISLPLVTVAAAAAGERGYRDQVPVLRGMLDALPVPATPLRTPTEILAEIWRNNEENIVAMRQSQGTTPQPDRVRDDRLRNEYRAAANGSGDYAVDRFRQMVTAALDQLARPVPITTAAADSVTKPAASDTPTASVATPLPDPDRELEQALACLAEPRQSGSRLGEACRTLARLERTDCFDEMAELLALLDDTSAENEDWRFRSVLGIQTDNILGSLTRLAQLDPERLKPKLVSVMKRQLERTDLSLTELVWNIWAADLRELRPELERFATLGPDDVEGERANSRGGTAPPATGRSHHARRVVALWNEADPLARAKLLLAFGLEESYSVLPDRGRPERAVRMRAELAQTAPSLSAADLGELERFLDWYEIERIPAVSGPYSRDTMRQFMQLARTELGLAR